MIYWCLIKIFYIKITWYMVKWKLYHDIFGWDTIKNNILEYIESSLNFEMFVIDQKQKCNLPIFESISIHKCFNEQNKYLIIKISIEQKHVRISNSMFPAVKI